MITSASEAVNDLPTPQMIRQIISSYRLDNLQLDGTPLEGTGYITFRAITPKGIFALRRKKGSAAKIMARHPDIESNIEGQHRLMLFLHEHGFPVAPPLFTKNKDTYVSILGIPCSLYPFINGQPLDPENLQQLRASAETLARFHQLTTEYSGVPPLSQPPFSELFEERLNDFREQSATFEDSPLMLRMGESMLSFNSSLDDIETEMRKLPYSSLPMCVIHGDYKPGNILFKGNDVAAVIDFGRSRNEARLFDIAKTIAGLIGTSDDATFLEMTRVFFTAYNSTYPLNNSEKKFLFSLIQARVAFKNLDKFISLAKKKDTSEKLAKAERFNTLVQRLQSLRNSSETIRSMFEGPELS
jgi:Ser/Thr protein kinase RdoA (MazF antagonist)